MPGLTIYITLDMIKVFESARLPSTSSDATSEKSITADGIPMSTETNDSDLVSFITGILLTNDQQRRIWFSQYIKSSLRVTQVSTQLDLLIF